MVHQVSDLSHIYKTLYLTSLFHFDTDKSPAHDPTTVVINVSSCPLPKRDNKTNTYSYNLYDSPRECKKMLAIAKECFPIIDTNLAQGKIVVVNCQMGISRSTSIVIYYLMTKLKMSYEEAFDIIYEKRWFIKPNIGFEQALKSLHK